MMDRPHWRRVRNTFAGTARPALSEDRVAAIHDTALRVLEELGIEIVSNRFMDFYDPWGNRIEIVGYDNIQFTKAPNVLRGMGIDTLTKTDKAVQELTDKGMAPE